jgi:hypothetical protein
MYKKKLETSISSFSVIARSVFAVKCVIAKFYLWLETNERRGNLTSLINTQEIFKITPLQPQSREIASGMQQHLAESVLITLLTKPRNDEIKYLPH